MRTRLTVNFSHIMQERRYTKYEIHVMTGLAYKTINEILANNHNVNEETLEKICKGFDVDILELYKKH